MKIFWLVITLVLISIFSGIGDHFTKKWATDGFAMTKNFLIANLFYWTLIPLWFKAFKTAPNMARTTCLWAIAPTAASIIVGAYIWKETITTTQWVGIALALVSIILMA